jgi:hypothetical protein
MADDSKTLPAGSEHHGGGDAADRDCPNRKAHGREIRARRNQGHENPARWSDQLPYCHRGVPMLQLVSSFHKRNRGLPGDDREENQKERSCEGVNAPPECDDREAAPHAKRGTEDREQ